MTTPPSRRRGLRVAAILAGALVAAVAAELVLRATHWGVYAPRSDSYNLLTHEGAGYWIMDPTKPSTQTWDRDPYGRLPPGATMTYPLNSHWLRGPEPDPARPKILFVGDSFTFGEGVAFDDTFPARVERLLASSPPPAPQSIDAGTPGYGSREEAARLPFFLDEFRPRAVVLVFVPNDPIPIDEEMGRSDFLRTGAEAPTCYLARLVSDALGRAAATRATEQWYLSYYFGDKSENWAATRRDLADMSARSKAAGAKFGVVVFPILHRLAERPFAAIHDAVAAECAHLGVPVLDLTDALAREPDSALWVHPADHHPDARAHEIAADAMKPFVEALLR